MKPLPPNVHFKGWGSEMWLHNEPDYCFKLLRFKPGGRGSMHFHAKKHETWYVAQGTFDLEMIDTKFALRLNRKLRRGDYQSIPVGKPHRLTCTSTGGGKIVEASTQHFEDDSYRIEPGDSQNDQRTKKIVTKK